jgi:hypothetical protein
MTREFLMRLAISSSEFIIIFLTYCQVVVDLTCRRDPDFFAKLLSPFCETALYLARTDAKKMVSLEPMPKMESHSQVYVPGQKMIVWETGVLGKNLIITLSELCSSYVRHECNTSHDVICQECETCGQGFYKNQTCGANYSNNRLDTQCSACPENYVCPGTTTFQQPLLCSEQQCGANQQVVTLCNVTHTQHHVQGVPGQQLVVCWED